MYADYAFYKTEFCGASIPDNSVFLSYEAKACRRLAYIIGQPLPESKDEVKNAVCAIAEILYDEDTGGRIQSESNDGVSVSYRTNEKSLDSRIFAAASECLSGTGLIGRWL
jgi:hypothetical protein